MTTPSLRVRLRPLRLDDVDHIMAWINDPEVTRNFATMSQQITREQELSFLEKTLASDADRLWAIESTEGAYLGNAGLHRIYWPAKNARMGIVLGHRRGEGLGREAMMLLLDKAFRELDLHKVWMMHFAANERMAHLATSLGFVEEGVLLDEYWHDGSFHDMVRRCLLRQHFDARVHSWGLPS